MKQTVRSGSWLPGQFMRLLASGLILNATFSYNAFAQTSPTELAQSAAPQTFNQEQLDSLVASIALYPDELLTQVLMASTFPLEVVAAARWVEDPSHKSLSGDALTKALTAESWDPSVKSLVPFPLVLATMNSNLTWLQQLGYAFASQQADVFAAVQRVRQLARANDKLKSTPQQVVTTEQVTVEAPAGSGQTQREVIVIQPAQSNTVYVPAYDPNVVYGSSWPSTSYPPYYAVPPAGYNFGAALATGMTFAAGAAIVGGLWGWARPAWGGGYANVNVNTFNSINASRPPLNSSRWAATTVAGHPGNVVRPPGGPVGLPGRPQVSVPGSAVRPPTRPVGAGNVAGVGRPGGPGGVAGVGRAGRPGGPGGVAGVGGAGRPGGPGGVAGVGGAGRPSGPGGIAGGGGVGRPGGMGGAAGTGRPGGGGGAATPGQLPARGGQGFAGAQRPGGAFGDMNSGRNAGQFGQRGAQSRTIGQQRSFAGGGAGSFGGGRRAGGGRGRR